MKESISCTTNKKTPKTMGLIKTLPAKNSGFDGSKNCN